MMRDTHGHVICNFVQQLMRGTARLRFAPQAFEFLLPAFLRLAIREVGNSLNTCCQLVSLSIDEPGIVNCVKLDFSLRKRPEYTVNL